MSWPATVLTEVLGIRFPIVQAPMAGGPTTPELVAGVSEAGGLGSIGAAVLPPDALRESIRRVRALTGKPFAVNLFAPLEGAEVSAETAAAVEAVLAPYRRAHGLPTPEPSGFSLPPDTIEPQLEVVVEERVPVFSFTFGPVPIEAVREAGAVVMGTATTVAEAVALEELGVDAIVAQGSEAGGHRGSFAVPFEQGLVGTIALVPQVVDRVSVPVVAAGGIGDGRGIAAALSLGAAGAQLGTAFLACPESGISESYKTAVLAAPDSATAVTRVYTGRPARAITTPLIDDLEASGIDVAPFPAQAALLMDLRLAGAEADVAELQFLLAGQAAGLARRLPAGELVRTLVAETEAALGRR